MFTGIIQKIGEITEIMPRGPGKAIRVRVEGLVDELRVKIGDSVAVDGVCLTAETLSNEGFTAYLSRETLSRTKFSRVLRPGYPVNIETPLTPNGFLGGHMVQGHVDAVARVKRLVRAGPEAELVVELGAGLTRYTIEKASVAVDGVSLTVAGVGPRWFSVALVQHTLENTTLRHLRPGSLVNLEFDMVAKYIERFLMERGTN